MNWPLLYYDWNSVETTINPPKQHQMKQNQVKGQFVQLKSVVKSNNSRQPIMPLYLKTATSKTKSQITKGSIHTYCPTLLTISLEIVKTRITSLHAHTQVEYYSSINISSSFKELSQQDKWTDKQREGQTERGTVWKNDSFPIYTLQSFRVQGV